MQAHAGLALGYERLIGTGVLGDDDLLKRSSVVLEQTDDGGEQLDGDEGRQRCGDGGRNDVGAGGVGA